MNTGWYHSNCIVVAVGQLALPRHRYTRCPKASICSFQVFLGTLRFRLGLGQKESVFPLLWVKIDWGQRLAPLTCVSRARVSAQRACSERRCRSAASSGSPCGLEVLHMGNVVWTTAGALLGSINAGRYVGVDVEGMYIAEWGSYVSLLFCLVIQRLLVYTNPDISDRYTHIR